MTDGSDDADDDARQRLPPVRRQGGGHADKQALA